MISHDYLDGNAAAGELSAIFAVDITTAQAECVHCGAHSRFAETHVYMECPGVVVRCQKCEGVLLRLVHAPDRIFLDLRGMTCLKFPLGTSKLAGSEEL